MLVCKGSPHQGPLLGSYAWHSLFFIDYQTPAMQNAMEKATWSWKNNILHMHSSSFMTDLRIRASPIPSSKDLGSLESRVRSPESRGGGGGGGDSWGQVY